MKADFAAEQVVERCGSSYARIAAEQADGLRSAYWTMPRLNSAS